MRGDLGTGEAAIFSEPRRGKGLGGDAAAASAAGVFEAGGARRDCRPSASITSTHLLPPAPYRGESLVAARFETQPGLSAPLPCRHRLIIPPPLINIHTRPRGTGGSSWAAAYRLLIYRSRRRTRFADYTV